AVHLEAGQQARPKKGVLWVDRHAGSLSFLGREDTAPILNGHRVPISSRGYLQAREPSEIQGFSTEQYLQQGIPWEELHAFHALAMQTIARASQQESEAERERLVQKVQDQRRT